ncbi:MAG: PAS domain-containing protein [Rhodomicrobium sp.]
MNRRQKPSHKKAPSGALESAEEAVARLAAIVTSSSDAIISKTLDGTVLTWNEAAVRLFGYGAEEMMGQPVRRLIPLQLQAEENVILERIAAGGPLQNYETLRRHKDGRLLQVSVTISPIRDAVGNVTGASKIARDISERKRNEEQFQALADGIPTLCWMAEPDGHRYWYNKRWYDYTGTTPEEMQSRGWQSTQDPEVLPEVLARWRSSLASGAPFEMTFPLRGADGVFRPFLTRVAPDLGPDGRVRRWLGVNMDLTEERLMRAALEQSEARLRLFIEDAPAAIAMFDKDMRYLAASRRFVADLELDGESPESLLGRSHYELFPEIPDRWRDVYRRVLAGETLSGEEDEFLRLNGTTDWVRWEMTPWQLADGSVGGALLFSEVITRRRQAEAALRESQLRQRGMIQSAMDAIIAIDGGQTIVSFNPAAEKMFGCPASEALGRSIDRFIPVAFRRAHRQEVRRDGRDIPPDERARLGVGPASGRQRVSNRSFNLPASGWRAEAVHCDPPRHLGTQAA